MNDDAAAHETVLREHWTPDALDEWVNRNGVNGYFSRMTPDLKYKTIARKIKDKGWCPNKLDEHWRKMKEANTRATMNGVVSPPRYRDNGSMMDNGYQGSHYGSKYPGSAAGGSRSTSPSQADLGYQNGQQAMMQNSAQVGSERLGRGPNAVLAPGSQMVTDSRGYVQLATEYPGERGGGFRSHQQAGAQSHKNDAYGAHGGIGSGGQPAGGAQMSTAGSRRALSPSRGTAAQMMLQPNQYPDVGGMNQDFKRASGDLIPRSRFDSDAVGSRYGNRFDVQSQTPAGSQTGFIEAFTGRGDEGEVAAALMRQQNGSLTPSQFANANGAVNGNMLGTPAGGMSMQQRLSGASARNGSLSPRSNGAQGMNGSQPLGGLSSQLAPQGMMMQNGNQLVPQGMMMQNGNQFAQQLGQQNGNQQTGNQFDDDLDENYAGSHYGQKYPGSHGKKW